MSVLPSFFDTFVQPKLQQATWYPLQHSQHIDISAAESGFTQGHIHFITPTFSSNCELNTDVSLHSTYPAYIQYPNHHIYYSDSYLHQNLYRPYHIPLSRMKRLRTVPNLQNIATKKNEFTRVEVPEVPIKRFKKASFIVKPKEMRAFFGLLADELIQDFLEADSCFKVSDKYLLAMVFAYFKRACVSIREYTRANFFVALYLANDVEEDDEDLKYEIFPWALGRKWKDKYPQFLLKRDRLFKRIGYRAIVSRRCCDEIMDLSPNNIYWTRVRPIHHAGAIRNYMRDPDDDGYPRGPDASPRLCRDCDITDSQYDTASCSPTDSAWYISSGDSTPEPQHLNAYNESDIFLNMQGLKQNLPKTKLSNDDVWPTSSKEE